MALYQVAVPTEGFEIYVVEADSPEEARESWFDGECVTSEVAWSGEDPVVLGEED
jgi:hypothetical protein